MVGTLADLPELARAAGIGPPALLVVGEVVARRPGLAWFEDLPLFGQRIVVTRPSDEAEPVGRDARSPRRRGPARPRRSGSCPSRIFGPLDDAIDRLDSFDWLVFTSGNGVRHFLDRLDALGLDLRALGRVKLAAIGPSTAEALADLSPQGRPRPRVVPLRGARRGAGTRRSPVDGSCSPGPTEAGRSSRTSWGGSPTSSRSPLIGTRTPSRSRRTSSRRIEAGSVDWITLTSPAIAERFHGLLTDSARAQDRPRDPPGQPEPGHVGRHRPARLAGGRRGDGPHLGRPGRRDRRQGRAGVVNQGLGAGGGATSPSGLAIEARSSVKLAVGVGRVVERLAGAGVDRDGR